MCTLYATLVCYTAATEHVHVQLCPCVLSSPLNPSDSKDSPCWTHTESTQAGAPTYFGTQAPNRRAEVDHAQQRHIKHNCFAEKD